MCYMLLLLHPKCREYTANEIKIDSCRPKAWTDFSVTVPPKSNPPLCNFISPICVHRAMTLLSWTCSQLEE